MRARPASRSWKRVTLVTALVAFVAVCGVGLASASAPLGQGVLGTLFDSFGVDASDIEAAVEAAVRDEGAKYFVQTDAPLGELDPADEIVERRTLHQKIYRVPGDHLARKGIISPGLLHYMTEDGELKDIVLEFADGDDGRAWITENTVKVGVVKSLADGPMLSLAGLGYELTAGEGQKLLLEDGDETSTLAVCDTSAGMENVDETDPTVRFPYALAGDLEVVVDRESAASRLILPASPVMPDVSDNARFVWHETMRLGDGLHLWMDGTELQQGESREGGWVIIADDEMLPLLLLQPPYAMEVDERDADDYSRVSSTYLPGHFRVTHEGDHVVVEKIFDAAWFAESGRQYPVLVDPTYKVLYTGSITENPGILANASDPAALGLNGTYSSGTLWYRPNKPTPFPLYVNLSSATNNTYGSTNWYTSSLGAYSTLRIGDRDTPDTDNVMRAWTKFNISGLENNIYWVDHMYLSLYLHNGFTTVTNEKMRVTYIHDVGSNCKDEAGSATNAGYCGGGGTNPGTMCSAAWMYNKAYTGYDKNGTGFTYWTNYQVDDTASHPLDGNERYAADLKCDVWHGERLIDARAAAVNRSWFTLGIAFNSYGSGSRDMRFGDRGSSYPPLLAVQYRVMCESNSDCVGTQSDGWNYNDDNCITQDLCVNNLCNFESVYPEKCQIGGPDLTEDSPLGCVPNGYVPTDTSNRCRVCASYSDQWHWSLNPTGWCPEDGNQCTFDERCSTSSIGSCTSTSVWPSGWSTSSKPGAPACVDYTCDGGITLEYAVTNEFCLIDADGTPGDPAPPAPGASSPMPHGLCYPYGYYNTADGTFTNPSGNECERCQYTFPGAGYGWTDPQWSTKWGYVAGGTSCNDESLATHTDVCIEESSDENGDGRVTAYCKGAPVDCSAINDGLLEPFHTEGGLGCASGIPQGDPDPTTCIWTINAGFCGAMEWPIGEDPSDYDYSCYADGDVDPDGPANIGDGTNHCRYCNSGWNQQRWYNRPNGTLSDASAQCQPGLTPSNYTNDGICQIGQWQCTDGFYSGCVNYVSPEQESCNGLDDDCDGTTDDLPADFCYDQLQSQHDAQYWACYDAVCDGAGGCTTELKSGVCYIDGICYTNGQSNPNPTFTDCQLCNSGASTSTWTNRAAGTACSAEQPVNFTCTDDICGDPTNPAEAGRCLHVIQDGTCLIPGIGCRNDGDESGDMCYECEPSVSNTAWTYMDWNVVPGMSGPKTCNDGDVRTFTDICRAAEAGCGGTPYVCDDGDDCTIDSYTGEPFTAPETYIYFEGTLAADGSPGGGCNRYVDDGFCYVDGVCRPQGGSPPADPPDNNYLCLVCDTDQNIYAWSFTPPGESCTGETPDIPCTSDVCDGAGVCEHNLDDDWCLIDGSCFGHEVANGENICEWCDADLTDGTGSLSEWTNKPYGMTCTGDGLDCTQDWCDGNGTCFWDVLKDDTCLIDGECWVEGALRIHDPAEVDDNECLTCASAVNDRDWSPMPVTAPCDGDDYACTDDHCGDPLDPTVAGTCTHPLQDDFCLIPPPVGSPPEQLWSCVDEGGRNPLSTCDWCDTSVATDAWTPVPAGDPCNIIAGNPVDTDGFPCTDDVCDGASVCENNIQEGACLIENKCWADGDENGQCFECDNPVGGGGTEDAWTYILGKACDDDDDCSHTDVCITLVAPLEDNCQGTEYTCDDEKPCTSNTCSGTTGGIGGGTNGGDCVFTRDPGYCIIAGLDPTDFPGGCVEQDDLNPENDCQDCAPSVDPSAWTDKLAGEGCKEDSFGCTQDMCDGEGACTHPVKVGNCLIGGECWGDEALHVHDPYYPIEDGGTDNKCEWCEENVTSTTCIVDDDCPGDQTCGFVTDSPALEMYCVDRATVWTDVPFNGDVTEHLCDDDGITCTHDYCGGAGACIHPIDLGETGNTPACLIDIEVGGVPTPTCWEQGDERPSNKCEQCNPARTQTDWSPQPEFTPCYTDAYACTDDVCGDDNRICEHRVQDGLCLLETDTPGVYACYGDDARRPGVENDCRWCDPELPTPCAPACGAGETCVSGVCVPIADTCNYSGDPVICGRSEQLQWTNVPAGFACDDPWDYPCTTDKCDGAGTCGRVVDGGTCLIGGACFDNPADPENDHCGCWNDRDLNPDDFCQWCDAVEEPRDWSFSPEDTDCEDTGDDGHLCTYERCDGAGTCLHPIHEDSCLINPDGTPDNEQCFGTHDQYSSNLCQWCEPTGEGGQTDFSPATPGIDCTGTGDDGQPCTNNVCGEDAEAGTCVHPALPGQCYIAGECYTDGDDNDTNACLWCASLSDPYDWSDKPYGVACPDEPLSCTNDICSGGVCTHVIRPNDCLIDGVCFDEYESSGLNECLYCDPSLDQEDFSAVPGPALAPEDPNTPVPWPTGWNGIDNRHGCGDDTVTCTDDACDGFGSCVHFIMPSNCYIGQCRVDGAESGMCEECEPSADQLTWTWMVDKPCDDYDTCTYNDVCIESPQGCQGTFYGDDCNDGLVCTTDDCNGDGTCTNDLLDGWCLILDTCYAADDQNSANPCLYCDPDTDPLGWTNVPNDTYSETCYLEACGIGVDPDTLNVGVCRSGLQWCSGGSFGACEGAICPSEELCNGEDDDCDTFTDEVWNDEDGAPVGLRLGDVCDGAGDDDECDVGVYVCRPDGADVYCDEGIQAYFKFEEGSGATTTAAQTVVGDGLLALPSWSAAGEGADGGFALSFDGVDDYVTVPHSELLDVSNTLTFSAWINLSSASAAGWHVILAKLDPSLPIDGYAFLVNVGQSMGLSAYFPTCGGFVASGTTPVMDEWVHVAVTYNGTTAILYMDGEPVHSASCGAAVTASASDLSIGGYGAAAPSQAPWNGMLDNVAIYDIALDADAIKALARLGDFCDGSDNDCDGAVDEELFPILRPGDPNDYPAGAPELGEQGEACDSGDDHDWCTNGVYECATGGLAIQCGSESPSELVEICNGLDDDCDTVLPIDEYDEDSDGFMVCENDCDDHSSLFNPDHPEMCDGFDNNCDTLLPLREQDIDGDSYMACLPPEETAYGGYTEVDDCDDNNPLIHRFRPELCNGFDDDCDAMVDADDDNVLMFGVTSMTPFVMTGEDDTDPSTPGDQPAAQTSTIEVYGKNFYADDIHFDFGFEVTVDDIVVHDTSHVTVTVTVPAPLMSSDPDNLEGPRDVRIDLGTCVLVIEDGIDVVSPANVPSLSEWGIIILGLLLLGLGVWAVRRRQGIASIA